MAINIYEQSINPINGEALTAISLTPYAFTMQWISKPGVKLPFQHLHYYQDEIYYVKKGEIKVLMDGKEHVAGPGEKVIVPKGKRHAAINNKDEELETLIEYRPALDQVRLMQCYNGLVNDGYLNESGSVNMRMMGYMVKKMKCKALARPASVPASVFKLMLNVSYLIGKLSGWNKLYEKYTQ
ncbi:cupin domain-containing protein [Mucilaginibacter sp.]|jgi:quercetin dioxygenase-like cupin family protein|uniref:cupin domain-containing protein n=1 Tax=Mucilaginibacter sp. TaxID=1882438 RepID=UPI002C8C0886|nr:cupin domain-containing protein [Mucilaginibacter sp.]HTI57815.1 cupin domain-containing protein [Mucilaginibacter sp.]